MRSAAPLAIASPPPSSTRSHTPRPCSALLACDVHASPLCPASLRVASLQLLAAVWSPLQHVQGSSDAAEALLPAAFAPHPAAANTADSPLGSELVALAVRLRDQLPMADFVRCVLPHTRRLVAHLVAAAQPRAALAAVLRVLEGVPLAAMASEARRLQRALGMGDDFALSPHGLLRVGGGASGLGAWVLGLLEGAAGGAGEWRTAEADAVRCCHCGCLCRCR